MNNLSSFKKEIHVVVKGHRQKSNAVLRQEILALIEKQSNNSSNIIADIIGMCLETKHPREFPSVEALMIRDKIVLKYLVTKGVNQ